VNERRPQHHVVALAAELRRRGRWVAREGARSEPPGRRHFYEVLADLYRQAERNLTPSPSDQALRDAHALLTLSFRRLPK
jgi:hypothetical protein